MSNDKALFLVLDLRKKDEDKALQMWADAKNAVFNFQKQIEQLIAFEHMYQQELENKSKNSLDMQTYMAYQEFMQKLENIKLRQEQGLIELQAQEQRAKDNYLQKQQQRKIIESLIEKHKKARLLKEAKALQKLTDELVSSKQARILIEKNLKN